MKVAVLTQDTDLFKQICDAFSDQDVQCVHFCKDHALIRALPRQSFSLIMIDGMHCHPASCHPVSIWRACYSDDRVPVMMIGQFLDPALLKENFYAGADDVIFGPMNARELNLRVQRLLARQRTPLAPSMLQANHYLLDKHHHTACIKGNMIQLTAREFAIAWLFFSYPGRFLSRQYIAEAIWGSNAQIASHTLEQHIYKLRKKLHLGKNSDAHLKTIYALGYRLDLLQKNDNGALRATSY